MQIVLEPEALSDLQAAYDWYESQLDGLGEDFIEAIDAAIALIRRMPELYPVIYRDSRRVILNRFQYQILFVVGNQEVSIFALMHTRRDPKSWQTRRDES